MLKAVIFDFDGTLADSKAVFITAYNELALKYGYTSIHDGNILHLRKLSMLARFKALNIPFFRVPFLTAEFLSLYRKRVNDIELEAGMAEVLTLVGQSGHQLFILSSNAPDIIQSVLKFRGINSIDQVYYANKLFGKDRVFRRLIKDHNLLPSEVCYVCDELRDVAACEKVGITPVWVSWGLNSRR